MSDAFSNDGSFMAQFLQKNYASTLKKLEQEKVEQETHLLVEGRKTEKERKKEEHLLNHAKELEQLEKDTKEREIMVQRLRDEQKRMQEAAIPKPVPKARKQPFVSSSKPITGKRPPSSMRSTPAMPVMKKQRTTMILPRNRIPTTVIAPPKPPPLSIKSKIDTLIQVIISKSSREPISSTRKETDQYSFLTDTSSEEYKYYEYALEKKCEEKGILLAPNVPESSSLKKLDETYQKVSMKYKDLEKKLEEEDKVRKSQRPQLDTIPFDHVEKEKKFIRKLESHFHNEENLVDVAPPVNPLLASSSKGLMLMKNMGWKEGTGLGANSTGTVAPIIADEVKLDTTGLGAETEEDIFASYQKRMREQYRSRPRK